METYWREVQNIKDEEEEREEEEEETCLDEAELEEAWLSEAGLSSLVTGSATEDGPADALLSTLTRQQVATVTERLENYKQTLRKTNRPAPTPSRTSSPRGGARGGVAIRGGAVVPGYGFSYRGRPADALLSTLTRQQVATVTERLENYKQTLRKTNRPAPTHVQDIFTTTYTQTLQHTHSPPAHTDISTHTHTDTKTPAPLPTHTANSHLDTKQTVEADWLVSELPYSEGVSNHKRGVASQHLHGNTDLLVIQLPSSRGVLVRVEDLSPADVTQLGFIALIELSTFLSSLGVRTPKTKTHRHRAPGKDSGVFGVPLSSLLERDRKLYSGETVPAVFRKLLCILEQTGLDTEGILRVPGSAARLKFLRRELNKKFSAGQFDWSTVRPQEASGLMKMFLRDLPSPLLTSMHLPAYTALLGIPSQVHQVQALHLLTLLLPEANRHLLKVLLSFLGEVVSHQDRNRMSLWNVSMVIAPNLFPSRHGNKRCVARQQQEMEEAVGAAHLVQLLVAHRDLLWTVPCFLLAQVRRVNQVTRHKKGLKKRQDKNYKNQVPSLWEGVIRVHAPLHSKVSMAIQLDGHTRAKDVIARFQYENRAGYEDVNCLFEVGGNIGERCLHPDTVLMDVHLVNPSCSWLLKPRPQASHHWA
ncbi:rho GTPase-activating protein 28 [Gadus macrocephalus]|uniref:rho GTPase-activating protein 28 n=1 Tax=Gadus macrocephalus TaxID=80720 RepID=UPI0028CB46AD|nr:rho GTPase-activating protein 28 [Gadus macrocephalus]